MSLYGNSKNNGGGVRNKTRMKLLQYVLRQWIDRRTFFLISLIDAHAEATTLNISLLRGEVFFVYLFSDKTETTPVCV